MKYTITSGPIKEAKRIVFYGVEGIGKTSLLALTLKLLGGVLIDTEGGSGALEVGARMPRPESWSDFIEMLKYIRTQTNYKAIGIDTLDWLEQLCIKELCEKKGWAGIETPGYGKGYIDEQDMFKAGLDELDKCRAAGIHILCAAHSKSQKFEAPGQTDTFDRWSMKLSKTVSPLVREWCDALIFLNYETTVVYKKDEKKGAAVAEKRMMYSEHTASFDAKNRYGLPAKAPMDADNIKAMLEFLFKPEEKPEPAPAPENPDFPFEGPDEGPVYDKDNLPPFDQEEHDEMLEQFAKRTVSTIFPELAKLMERDGVSYSQLQYCVGKKGYYGGDVPIELYDEKFVNEGLVANWASVLAAIKNN